MKMVKCIQCGEMVSDELKRCPKCDCPVITEELERKAASQSSGIGKVLIGVLLGLLLVVVGIPIILTLILGKGKTGGNSLSGGLNKVYAKGDVIKVSDYEITINDLAKQYTVTNDSFIQPSDGNKFVMASFTFKNVGKTDAYVSIYDFDCYADNIACSQVFLPVGGDFINTNLSSGKSVKVMVFYEVPKNANNITLEYRVGGFGKDKRTIKF